MKKMKYDAPQIEVVRFELEEILNTDAIISGTKMDGGVKEVGGLDLDSYQMA
ncbi:MAG: hypothetical protein IKJ74_01540 [Clostridia bacterium]|nr:hypothetical protein [Clostridia bacterium]